MKVWSTSLICRCEAQKHASRHRAGRYRTRDVMANRPYIRAMITDLTKAAPTLKPTRQMKPNEPCWCLSGLKWKKCHYRREDQVRVNQHKVAEELRKTRERGTCLHPEASDVICNRKAIQSHTVQRNQGLRAVSENNHVLSFKLDFGDLIRSNGALEPKRLGLKKASVFPGFCSKHDAEVFAPAEIGTFKLGSQTSFLLSYRATCYELFAKIGQQDSIRVMKNSDKGQPFERQASIQQYAQDFEIGSKAGLNDIRSFKKRFDSGILSENTQTFCFIAYELKTPLPIVVATAFYPEFDFMAQPLQSLGYVDPNLEHIAINITSRDGKGVVVFGWFEYGNGAARRFAESFDFLSDTEKGSAIVRMAFDYSENTFFRQSWWETLDEGHKNALVSHVRSGADPLKAKVGDLRADGTSYASIDITNRVSA